MEEKSLGRKEAIGFLHKKLDEIHKDRRSLAKSLDEYNHVKFHPRKGESPISSLDEKFE